MSLALDVPTASLGRQEPRLLWVPPYASSTGDEAIELAELAGLFLDPWQRLALRHGLGERPDGLWAALEVGVVVSRQNGKGGILEARELAGLFLLGERLIIHSAHQFDTSLEAFARLLALIEDTPELASRVKRVIKAAGQEGIELKGRQRIRFRTRTKSGGRGFTGDCVILDEAMILSKAMHGALMPTLSARPNPQLWYMGSAVDEEVHEHGLVFAKVRERGLAGNDPRLAYFEWSVARDRWEKDPQGVATDPDSWALSNPALGIRISPDYVASEQRSMDARTFATERLGVGFWPDVSDDAGRVIPSALWRECADPQSRISSDRAFALDATPDRDAAAISAAGKREDGNIHVGVVESRKGLSWVPEACRALSDRYKQPRFHIHADSPAITLVTDLRKAGVFVRVVTSDDYKEACAKFYDLAIEGNIRYMPPQPELDLALKAAEKRHVGDRWVWDRRNTTDISPLVASTLAVWRAAKGSAARIVNLATLGDRRAQTPLP